MRRKYKLTGCARFLIFLVIAVPVIYISATLITGTSPLEEVKMMLSGDGEKKELPETKVKPDEEKPVEGEQLTSSERPSEHSPAAAGKSAEKSDQQQLNELLNRIESLEKKLKELQEQLDN